MNQENPMRDEIVAEVRDGTGIIILNRPASLNALSLDMIRRIASLLRQWERDDAVRVVIFSGYGERAFCAGGDVKAFYRAGMDYRQGRVGARVPSVYFAEEYSLNRQIFHYPKPVVAFMNGITMGGGYGLAGHARYRVATEKTVFAMPEVGIGFYPDVGSIYHLCRAHRNFGRYLALSGNSISGADMVRAGLADYYVQSGAYEPILRDLARVGDAGQVLERYREEPPHGLFTGEEGGRIEALFSDADILSVMRRIEEDGSDFSMRLREDIMRRSPLAVRVASSYLMRAAGLSFDEVIATDFVLTQNFVTAGDDFYEGIRAQVIDKDRTPRWCDSSLADVPALLVNQYFTSTGYDLKDVRIF